MLQIALQPRVTAHEQMRTRLTVVCTKCEREVRRIGNTWDCGTPHRPGTAQMQYRRVHV